jgi:hypothetical protein
MRYNRFLKKCSSIMILVQLSQSFAYADSPDAKSLRMLRDIYTQLAQVNGNSKEDIEISVEEELGYFKKNVRDIESAQQLILSLHSLSHAHSDFDYKQQLHPILAEIRQHLSDTKFTGLLKMNRSDDRITNEQRNEQRNDELDFLNYKNAILFIVGFFVFSTFLMSGVHNIECQQLCERTVLKLSPTGLMGRDTTFPGNFRICQSYYLDHDQSRNSDGARYNYIAIGEAMGNPDCLFSRPFSQQELAAFGAAIVFFLLPAIFNSAKNIYSNSRDIARSFKGALSSLNSKTPTRSPDLELSTISNTVTAVLGIRHLDEIISKVVGIRVLVHPCSNEFDNCPICFEDFQGFENTVATSCCNKKFDQECLEVWFRASTALGRAQICPNCCT